MPTTWGTDWDYFSVADRCCHTLYPYPCWLQEVSIVTNSLIKWITNCSSLSKTIQVEKLCNFQILYRKNFIALFVVIVIYIRIKWVFLDTESITVITISNIINSRSLTMKFIFIVFHLILDIDSRHSSPRSKCHDSLVYKQRLQMLTY